MLNSFFKVINTHSVQMATICADAVQKVADAEKNHLDLKDIQIVSKVGGTLDDTELVDGLCIDQGALGNHLFLFFLTLDYFFTVRVLTIGST